MSGLYHLDLARISLEEYLKILKEAELIPSRRFLKEDIDTRFARLKAAGIGNLEELRASVKNKAQTAELARAAGLEEEYLTVLRREVNSLVPASRHLKDFPGVDPRVVEKLAVAGIRNTKQLFDRAGCRSSRAGLAETVGVDPGSLLEVVKLSDLSRIYGVGPIFARLLYDAGLDSVRAVARSSSRQLFDKLAAAYLAAGNSRVDFKERDIAFCIQMARRLPEAIEP